MSSPHVMAGPSPLMVVSTSVAWRNTQLRDHLISIGRGVDQRAPRAS